MSNNEPVEKPLLQGDFIPRKMNSSKKMIFKINE